jgi:hypothetical protein
VRERVENDFEDFGKIRIVDHKLKEVI